eukprot:4726455-Prymnesium_polylepis.3
MAALRALRVAKLSAAAGGGFGVTFSTGIADSWRCISVSSPRAAEVPVHARSCGCVTASVETSFERALCVSATLERALAAGGVSVECPEAASARLSSMASWRQGGLCRFRAHGASPLC